MNGDHDVRSGMVAWAQGESVSTGLPSSGESGSIRIAAGISGKSGSSVCSRVQLQDQLLGEFTLNRERMMLERR